MPKVPQFPALKQPDRVAQNPQGKSLNELIAERDCTITEIERRNNMPVHVQAQFSNSLEARLALLDRQIMEREEAEAVERLEKLDCDLISGNRSYSYLFAVRGGLRIKIQIMPSKAFGFVAICYFNRRQMYAGGRKPSQAFARLLDNIKYQIKTERQ